MTLREADEPAGYENEAWLQGLGGHRITGGARRLLLWTSMVLLFGAASGLQMLAWAGLHSWARGTTGFHLPQWAGPLLITGLLFGPPSVALVVAAVILSWFYRTEGSRVPVVAWISILSLGLASWYVGVSVSVGLWGT